MIHLYDANLRKPQWVACGAGAARGSVRLRVVLSPGMRAKLDIGRTYSRQSRVEEWMTAEKAGNKGVDVLSTPMLVQLIEDAAMACIAPVLEEGQLTLGTHIDLEHHRPVPVGFIVRTEVEVVLVDGPRISFAVQVFDEQEAVAEGTHERYIMDRAKFLAKLEEKLA
ncbi:MAG TPA: thioesterase family protein [Candidatus Baltobacteraceae bacterium]|nr:thioesterase family protein [Candidatus Baltobacteraceae bacterium]